MSLKNKSFYYELALNENLIKGGWRKFTVQQLKSILIENNVMDDRENLIGVNVESKVYDTDIGMIDQSRPNEEYVMYNFDEYSEYRIVNDNTINHIIQA